MNVELGTVTTKPSPHAVGPADLDVFTERDVTRERWMFPLATVDHASLVAGAWPPKLHFIYCEYNQEPLRFAAEDDKYRLLANMTSIEHAMTVDSCEPPTRPTRWHGTHLAFKRASAATLEELRIEAKRLRVHRRSFVEPLGICIGGEPDWMQMPEWPADPDGNAMTFLGQLSAPWLSPEVAGFSLYLFGSRAHGIVAQVSQVT